MRNYVLALALTVVLVGFLTPAQGLSVSASSGTGSDSSSTSSTYTLDKSSSLQESVTLADGEISKDLTASGSGENSISISSSANEKIAGAEIESSGNFQTFAFARASGVGAGISQNTAMSGSYGGITYHAESPENKMAISSSFDGEGDLTAGISASAGEKAAMSGNLNSQGMEILDSESLQALAFGDLSMSVDGLYSQPNGELGSFGLNAANTGKETVSSETSALLAGPAITANGGRNIAYSLMGTRWNTRDPKLKLVLKNDANMAAEGLSASEVRRAITAAANTWDDATNQNLFADSSTVTLDPWVTGDSYNGKNTVNFKPYSGNCIAYSKSWFTMAKVGGYYSTIESDLVFNTRYTWRTDGSNSGYDVQSVALHELGHTLGLSDLYNKASFKGDLTQVMNRYTGVKRTLGNGDKTGIWTLYG